MSYARAKGFIVMTSDLDFSAILAATNAKGPSVVQLRARDVMPAAIGNLVLVALRTCAADLQRGALLERRLPSGGPSTFPSKSSTVAVGCVSSAGDE